MNLVKIGSRHLRILKYLLIFSIAAAVAIGLAQTEKQRASQNTIDGKLQPDRIPESIVWTELFEMTVHLYEAAPDHGRGFWMDRLHLSEKTMESIVASAYENQKMRSEKDDQIRNYVTNAGARDASLANHPNKAEAIKSKRIAIQMDRDARTLEIRDKLREIIGEDAFMRMSSYARLNITPKIKIGG